jgi:hypothetical protein
MLLRRDIKFLRFSSSLLAENNTNLQALPKTSVNLTRL